MTIGACATAGGIQSLRNWKDVDQFIQMVYATPSYIKTLAQSTPISAHVPVDFELNGCPINKKQVLEVITSLLLGRAPHLPAHSVCVECKRRGTVCIPVAQGVPCLGPLTHAGCGAICPAYNRGCYGCYGPMESPNPDSLMNRYASSGTRRSELVRLLRGFTGFQEAFRAASDKLEKMGQ
jgi:coenzyme F420-reducing hydrogenase gamma subunit